MAVNTSTKCPKLTQQTALAGLLEYKRSNVYNANRCYEGTAGCVSSVCLSRGGSIKSRTQIKGKTRVRTNPKRALLNSLTYLPSFQLGTYSNE